MRLDKLLVERGFYPSREKAQFEILQKCVLVDGVVVDKPSKNISETATITIRDQFNRYVSRGGLKLEKGIADFNLDFVDKKVLDIGASTGGFTDCALQHGAAWVCGVDVGDQQLDPSLKEHPQVQSIENCDFRELDPNQVAHLPFDWVVSDLSFISLTYILGSIAPFIHPQSELLLLIKPQFEVGPKLLNKSGILSDSKGYKIAIERVVQEAERHNYFLHGLTISTLWEKHKNVEFLAHFKQQKSSFTVDFGQLLAEIKILRSKLK